MNLEDLCYLISRFTINLHRLRQSCFGKGQTNESGEILTDRYRSIQINQCPDAESIIGAFWETAVSQFNGVKESIFKQEVLEKPNRETRKSKI